MSSSTPWREEHSCLWACDQLNGGNAVC